MTNIQNPVYTGEGCSPVTAPSRSIEKMRECISFDIYVTDRVIESVNTKYIAMVMESEPYGVDYIDFLKVKMDRCAITHPNTVITGIAHYHGNTEDIHYTVKEINLKGTNVPLKTPLKLA